MNNKLLLGMVACVTETATLLLQHVKAFKSVMHMLMCFQGSKLFTLTILVPGCVDNAKRNE